MNKSQYIDNTFTIGIKILTTQVPKYSIHLFSLQYHAITVSKNKSHAIYSAHYELTNTIHIQPHTSSLGNQQNK